MQMFRIHRLKDKEQHQFRWAPHTSGAASVKPRDYEQDGIIQAPSVYAAWLGLRELGVPLRVGDLLESEAGDLRICKYVGFEEARWVIPEAKQGAESSQAGHQAEAEKEPVNSALQ
jgi:hypothetical protein